MPLVLATLFENHWFSYKLFNVFLYFYCILIAYEKKAESNKRKPTHPAHTHILHSHM